MGIFDRFFPKKEKHDHHHDHEHFDCPKCGQQFHDRNELEHHKAKAHAK